MNYFALLCVLLVAAGLHVGASGSQADGSYAAEAKTAPPAPLPPTELADEDMKSTTSEANEAPSTAPSFSPPAPHDATPPKQTALGRACPSANENAETETFETTPKKATGPSAVPADGEADILILQVRDARFHTLR